MGGTMNDINTVILGGRLTRDVELKSTSGGSVFARVSVASNRSVKVNDEWKDEAGFFDVVAWGKQAENLQKYFHKGSRIVVEGSLRWSSWENAEGKKQSKVEIALERFHFIDKREAGETGGQADTHSGTQAGVYSAPMGDSEIPF